MKLLNRIAVIGGGASGILAAVFAARGGAQVCIYERNDRIGRKILSTGNGRCNFSNRYANIDNYNGKNTAFIKNAMNKFWVDEAIGFFESLGMPCCEEDGGRLYPYSRQASAVCDVLRFEVERLGIRIFSKTTVNGIEKNGKIFTVSDSNGKKEEYNRVILSTGGMAAPDLGSDGMGYKFAKSFGHSIVNPRPVLVQLKTDKNDVKGLKGIKSICNVKYRNRESAGELLFTEYGVSGPPVFYLSSYVTEPDDIYIDFLPDYTENEVINMLLKRRSRGLSCENMLIGLVSRLIGINILKYSKISPLTKSETELTDDELKTIAHSLKARKIHVAGRQSWRNAQSTSGGINTDEVNSKTMESRLTKGLYFTGEILDIDGECGGFNLQWAWSSGYLAGISAVGK